MDRSLRLRAVLCVVLTSSFAPIATATAAGTPADYESQDGRFVNAGGPVDIDADFTILQDSGPTSNRIDLVIFGERYYADEVDCAESRFTGPEAWRLRAFPDYRPNWQPTYPCYYQVVPTVMQQLMQTRVYARYLSAFNIYRDDRYLNDGEVDDIENVSLLSLQATQSRSFSNRAGDVAPYDYAQGVLNELRSLPEGHFDVTFRHRGDLTYVSPFTGGGIDFLHEPAHSYYSFGDGCGPGYNNNTGFPEQPEWWYWVGFDQKVADNKVGDFEGQYVVGAYEGCSGTWRAQPWSIMTGVKELKYLTFSAVERETIILDFYDRLRPLDGWKPNGETLIDSAWLWVNTLSDDLIKVQWRVDGKDVGRTGPYLDVAALNLAPGTHSIEAHAYDEVVEHAYSDRSGRTAESRVDRPPRPLDMVRVHLDKLQQRVTWTVEITDAGSARVAMPLELVPATFSVALSAANGREVGYVLASGLPGETTTFGLASDAGERFAIHERSGRIVVADGSRLQPGETYSLTVTASAGNQEAQAQIPIRVLDDRQVVFDDDFDDDNWTTNLDGIGDGWFRYVSPNEQLHVGATVTERGGRLSVVPNRESSFNVPGHRGEESLFDWNAQLFARKTFSFDNDAGVTIGLKLADSPMALEAGFRATERRSVFVGRGGASQWVRREDPLILELYLSFSPVASLPGVCIRGSGKTLDCLDNWNWQRDFPTVWDGTSAAEIRWTLNRNGYVLVVNGTTVSAKPWPAGFMERWRNAGAGSDAAELMLESAATGLRRADALAPDQSWNIDRVSITRGYPLQPIPSVVPPAQIKGMQVDTDKLLASCEDHQTYFGSENCLVTIMQGEKVEFDLALLVPESHGTLKAFDVSPLPPGLTVSTRTGVITGAPTQSGETMMGVAAVSDEGKNYWLVFRFKVEKT